VPTVICATEVRAACEQLEGVRVVETEAPGVTYERLAAGEPLGANGWLVSQPWPDMAQLRGTSTTLARSPLVVVTTTRRPAGFDCPQATWDCVAGFAETSPNFAYGTRDTTGGLLARAGIAGGLLGKQDFVRNDFDDRDDFRSRYGALDSAVSDVTAGRSSDLATTIQTAVGTYAAVAVLDSSTDLARAGFEALTPTPEISADVVLAGHPDRFDLDRISDALLATGWLRSGDKTRPGPNGLPKPGVMVALRDLSR
jgi:hypothetical protein